MVEPPVTQGIGSRLSIDLLGQFSVWVGRERIADEKLHSRRARSLLKLLALAPGYSMQRDQVMDALWPDSDLAAAANNFHQTLYTTRRIVGSEYLVLDEGCLSLVRPVVDVGEFEAAAERARAGQDPEDYQVAVGLYTGDLLPGDLYEEWTIERRERLRQNFLGLLLELAGLHDQRGEYGAAIEVLHRVLGMERSHEEAHTRLMRLYALSGQRRQALRQYEALRAVLRQELDVEPGDSATALVQAIQSGRVAPAPAKQAPPHNLPAMFTSFIGREREIEELKGMLLADTIRLVTVSGAGGTGKTRLALEVARQLTERFPNGLYHVSLVPFQSTEAIVSAIAQLVGLRFLEAASPRAVLFDYLRQKKMLIILDGCETVPGAAELALELLNAAEGVKILATSREHFYVQEEHLFLLGGLAYPEGKATGPDQALGFNAVRLFLDGAQRLQPAYHACAEDIDAIADICQYVHGMPLAILHAASWIDTLSAPEIAAELRRNSLDLLRTEWRDLPERQRSMRAVFEYSYDLLEEDEKAAFEGSGVFEGGFSHLAALAVTRASLHTLRKLVDKTMLERGDGGRFRLHDLLRQFALHKLALRPGAEERLREEHMRFHAAALDRLAGDLRGPRQAAAVRSLLTDLPNFRAAWDWAVSHRRVSCLDMALDGLCGIYQWNSRSTEGVDACRLASESLRTTMSGAPGEDETRLLVRVLAWQVFFAHTIGQFRQAGQSLDLAFHLLNELDFQHETCRRAKAFLLQQAGLYYVEMDYPRARECWEESLDLYREVGNRWAEAQVLESLGWSSPHEDAFRSARAWLEESLAVRRELGDQRGMASALHHLSNGAAQAGDFDRMESLLQESLEYTQMAENPAALANVRYAMSVKLAYQGRFREALVALREVVRQYRELGLQADLSTAISILGWIETNLGQYAEARESVRVGLEIAIRMNNMSIHAMGTWGLGEIQAAEGLHEQALDSLRECIRLYRQLPQRDEMGMALGKLAAVEASLGLWDQARADLREGIQIAAQAGSWQARVQMLVSIARFVAEQGEVERAIELYSLAARYPYVGNSVYCRDVAGRRLEELARGLPAGAAEQARLRGEAQNLEETFDEIVIRYSGV